MKWLPIEQCNKQPGVRYLISGWIKNTPDTERWYTVAAYSEGYWWDEITLTELYPPTHFVYFNEVE